MAGSGQLGQGGLAGRLETLGVAAGEAQDIGKDAFVGDDQVGFGQHPSGLERLSRSAARSPRNRLTWPCRGDRGAASASRRNNRSAMISVAGGGGFGGGREKGLAQEGAALGQIREGGAHLALQPLEQGGDAASALWNAGLQVVAQKGRHHRRSPAGADADHHFAAVDHGRGVEVGKRGAVDDIDQGSGGAGQRRGGPAEILIAGDEGQQGAREGAVGQRRLDR